MGSCCRFALRAVAGHDDNQSCTGCQAGGWKVLWTLQPRRCRVALIDMASRTASPAELPLAGVVLAAGASVRFGSPKQVAVIAGGTLITRAVQRAVGQCDAGVVVVTGAHRDQWAAVLAAQAVETIHNPDWREGMGTSIRAGLTRLPEPAAGVLLMLCDQPAVTDADLDRLVTAWRDLPHTIAAARYAHSLGVPAVFPRSYRQRLRGLSGAGGAKQLILAADSVSAVDMPGAAVDIDTPEQLAEFIEQQQVT